MRILFFFFTLFVLLLAELWLGSCGVYLPLYWMGFFYFAMAQYSYRLIVPTGIIMSFVIDFILFSRMALPDIFILCVVLYMVRYHRETLCKSFWTGGIFGIIGVISGYLLQFCAALWVHNFSWQSLTDTAAMMVTMVPFGYFMQVLIIFMFDELQKRMKFESSFVEIRKEKHTSIYRRTRRFADD